MGDFGLLHEHDKLLFAKGPEWVFACQAKTAAMFVKVCTCAFWLIAGQATQHNKWHAWSGDTCLKFAFVRMFVTCFLLCWSVVWCCCVLYHTVFVNQDASLHVRIFQKRAHKIDSQHPCVSPSKPVVWQRARAWAMGPKARWILGNRGNGLPMATCTCYSSTSASAIERFGSGMPPP